MNFERDELIRLFGALSDGTINEADHQRLQETLRDSAEARRLWFLFNDIESGLASAPVVTAGAEPVMSAWRWWWGAAAAAAAVLGALLVFVPRKTSAPVAVLSAATNARWSDPNVELMLRGGGLPAGPMQLEAGVAEFAFAGGATAVIEGPAAFEPVAADRLLLHSGRAIGRCANDSAKLSIVTSNAVVTDLGTEFGVAVGDDRQTCVAVIKGAVELVAGKAPRRLVAGEAVAVDARGQMVDAQFVIKELAKLATILPVEEVAVSGAVNRLKDPGITDLGTTWRGTTGHVSRDSRGAMRVHANSSQLWPLLWQDVATGDVAGQVVVASVRALQPGDDPLNGSQNAIVKLVFLDASGGQFATAERHFLRATAPRDQWIRGQIAARAPPGTVAVQFQVLLNARGVRTGSVLFGDAGLFIVGSPTVTSAR